MEISKTSLRDENQINSLKTNAPLVSGESLVKKSSNPVSDSAAINLDTQDFSSFSELKKFIASAQQPSRANYITNLNQAIDSGSYNPSTQSIVDAMFADGTVEGLL
jgi:anti-sigma28 factor (negative regulator of flagellin synthesis)